MAVYPQMSHLDFLGKIVQSASSSHTHTLPGDISLAYIYTRGFTFRIYHEALE